MAYKLIDAAQDRWRAVDAPRLVALVCAGPFHKANCSKDPNRLSLPNRQLSGHRRLPGTGRTGRSRVKSRDVVYGVVL
ncbi:hypothetical protein BST14_18890 [Mycobacterium arosiense ATCC BAA-1401 = DSM 45069]|uniref:Uncharacterized protein n=1 Tax=Mycobacterium arosiense ATCC BAA-1401 = DSM 45069 TaxID=1265311 RepID=A0A1W9ZBB3_MYCAI|nr:hypothetical protein BST14_18890 [Mycobacterium arosiense ATCC BAA-1401 = DSM 45069]